MTDKNQPGLTVFPATDGQASGVVKYDNRDKLISDQVETFAFLGSQYRVIKAMAEGFTISTESGDTYTIEPTDAGLEPWLELARAHLNERVACVARTVAGFNSDGRDVGR
ncbi:MAG: hypothetical protein QM605_11605 [Sphingobium sp.]